MSRPPARFWETVAAVVLGILIVRKLDAWGVDPLSPVMMWGAMALIAIVVASGFFAPWRAGRKGLDQWPEPHGRYYSEWLRLPETQNGVSDYYEWLAKKMGNREPWRTWARQHSALSFSEYRSIDANDAIRDEAFKANERAVRRAGSAEDDSLQD